MDALKEKHLTQRQFAKLLGKSESEISSWLCGTHVFTTTTIAKIETILGRRLIETNRKKDHLPIAMKYNVIFCQESPKLNNDNWLTSLSNMKSYIGRPKECGLTC